MNRSICAPHMRWIPFVPVALFLAACGNNGGKTGLAPGAIDEQLTYDPASFSYVDPYTPDFHPLGDEVFVATEREEVMMLLAGATGQPCEAARYRDDVVQGGEFESCGGAWLSSGFAALSVAVGDLDGDGRVEPVYAGIDEDAPERFGSIRIGQPDAIGGPQTIDNVERYRLGKDPRPGQLSNVGITIADVDDDGRDDLIVVESWSEVPLMRIRVMGLVPSGDSMALVQYGAASFCAADAWVATGQFDDDPSLEYLLGLRCEAGTDQTTLWLVDDLAHGLAVIAPVWSGTDDEQALRPVVGQFDADPLDEILLEDGRTWFGRRRVTRLVLLDWTGTAAVPMAELSYLDEMSWNERVGGGLVVADRDQDGLDEVLWLSDRPETAPYRVLSHLESPQTTDDGCFFGPNRLVVELRSWQPTTGAVERYDLGTLMAHPGAGLSSDLVALDESGAGHRSVLATWKSCSIDELQAVCVDDQGQVCTLETQAAAVAARPLLAAGDFDDDGLRLRWTGGKQLVLAPPIPLLFASAPPTKAGVLQNYGPSVSTLRTADEPALVLRTDPSLGLTDGVSEGDLFGVLTAAGCDRLRAACEASTGLGAPVGSVEAFTGTHDADGIVFAGVLHQAYGYEVLGAPDPDAVGTLVSVNLPVQVRTYAWTVAHYLDVMPPEFALPDDLLEHQLGDPASYPREEDLVGLLAGHGGSQPGWVGSSVGVEFGYSAKAVALELADQPGGALGHAFEVSGEAASALVEPGEGSVIGLTSPRIYRVELSGQASFRGVIGDLEQDDWVPWFYDTGLVVYERSQPGQLPMLVQAYWTEPKGTQYP